MKHVKKLNIKDNINEEWSYSNVDGFWDDVVRSIKYNGYPINIDIHEIKGTYENGKFIPKIIKYERK